VDATLSRDFEMLVFGNGSGLPLILFPTSLGRYYRTTDFRPCEMGGAIVGRS